jgi:multidrug efflux pump subunit AcrA (membrane-fusion protein)
MAKTKSPKRVRLPKTTSGRLFLAVVILVVAALGTYFIYGAVANGETALVTYTTGTVEKMTLTSSVSGEGNVEWLQSADVTASGSGKIRSIRVAVGDKVKKGAFLFMIAGSMDANWVTAPIAGTVTALNVADGDIVKGLSSSRPAATIVDLDRFQAAITVAEADIASVQVGQKAIISFDALTDVTLTGKVKGVDFSGTISSGVVSYEVLVTPDVAHASVKGGMTVSVDIITAVATDVLAVPSSAIKTTSSGSYVQVFDENGQVTDVMVQTGLSNDYYVEIVSGLTEGQEIVVSTVTAGSTEDDSGQSYQGGLLDQGDMQGPVFIQGGGEFPGGGMAPPGQ